MGRRGDDTVARDAEEPSVDEKFRTLLEGLRTSLPGAQVLLGFLLVLPFQGSFADLSTNQERLYSTSFLASALASILLIAPSVHQRVRAPLSGLPRRDDAHLRAAIRVTLVGTAALVVAMVAVVVLVVDVVATGAVATLCAGAVGVTLAHTWLVQPLVIFGRDRGQAGGDGRGDMAASP